MSLSKLFVRPDSKMPMIDGIRAIAILWVVFFHAWIIQVLDMPDYIMGIFRYPLLYWVDRGDLGVDLFFVISGFLIGSIIFREIKSTGTFIFRQFYFRRFMRLTPVYIFAMALNMVLTNNYHIGHYWSNILYVNNYVPGSEMIWTWSLAMEEQFYLLAPCLLLFVLPLFKNKFHFFALFVILSLALNGYYVYSKMQLSLPYNVAFPTPEWFDWFNHYYRVTHLRFIGLLSGVAASYLHVYKTEEMKVFFQRRAALMIRLVWLSLIVVLFIAFIPLGEWTVTPKSLFYLLPDAVGKVYEVCNKGLFSFAVAYSILAGLYGSGRLVQGINRFLSSRFFYPIAQLSYSAYLFHVMFMFWIFPKLFVLWNGTMSPSTLFFLRYCIGIAGTFAMAVFMFYFIEQPFLRLRDRITFRKLGFKVFNLGRA